MKPATGYKTQELTFFSNKKETSNYKPEQILYTNSYYYLTFDIWKMTSLPYLREAERMRRT